MVTSIVFINANSLLFDGERDASFSNVIVVCFDGTIPLI